MNSKQIIFHTYINTKKHRLRCEHVIERSSLVQRIKETCLTNSEHQRNLPEEAALPEATAWTGDRSQRERRAIHSSDNALATLETRQAEPKCQASGSEEHLFGMLWTNRPHTKVGAKISTFSQRQFAEPTLSRNNLQNLKYTLFSTQRFHF